MKLGLKGLFVMFLLFVSKLEYVEAYEFFHRDGPCGTCENVSPGTQRYGSTIRLSDGLNCVETGKAKLNDVSAGLGALEAHCDLCTDFDADSCTEFGILICCDLPALETTHRRVEVVIDKKRILNVPIGGEETAARFTYEDFSSANSYPPAPEGFLQTDSLEGYVYTVSQGEAGDSLVDVTSWKRAGYGRQGTITTLDSLSSGGSGGSGSGSGLTQAQTEQAVEDALEGKLGTSEGSPDFYLPGADDTTFQAIYKEPIGSKVLDFLASNPIMSMFSQSGVDAIAGLCQWEAVIYGERVFVGFMGLEDILGSLGSVVLLVATVYSMVLAFGVRS